MKEIFNTVEGYLETLPDLQRLRMEEIRTIVKQTVPEAVEVISYNMPAFRYHGILIYFAAHQRHIGFYPGSTTAIAALKTEIGEYNTSKGTLQFPLDKKIPSGLLKKIVRYRAAENLEKEESRKTKKRK